jgi:hypothetical protein
VLAKQVRQRLEVEFGAVTTGACNDRIDVGNRFGYQLGKLGKPLLKASGSEEPQRDGRCRRRVPERVPGPSGDQYNPAGANLNRHLVDLRAESTRHNEDKTVLIGVRVQRPCGRASRKRV